MKRPITYLYYLAQGKRRLYWQNKIDAIPLMEKMHYKFAGREIESIEQVQQEMAQDILSGRPFMAGRLGAVELANMRAYEFDDRRILPKDVKQLCDCAGFFPNDISLMDQFFEEMINGCKSTDYLAAWFQPFEDYFADIYIGNGVIYRYRALQFLLSRLFHIYDCFCNFIIYRISEYVL